MSDTSEPKITPSPISQAIKKTLSDGSLREDFAEGLAGHHLSQSLSGLQQHREVLRLANRWAERANRIGWQEAGVDVSQIDKEMEAADEDVDSSIKFSGDTTHIHMAPNVMTGQQSEEPTPTQLQQPVQGKVPTWAKWLLGAAVAGNAVGIPAAAYFASKDSTTIIKPPDRSTIGLTIE